MDREFREGEPLWPELSARVVLFHTAIAARLGLNATDCKTLDLLNRNGPIAAGKLADLTGLTTGAVTGIVDRLARAGFVRRVPSEADRRQVTVETIPERLKDYLTLFDSLHRSMAELQGEYSPEEIAVVGRFLRRTIEVLKRETAELAAGAENSGPGS